MRGSIDHLHCFLPPHVLDKMAEAPDAETRRIAIAAKEMGAASRAVRAMYQAMPGMAASMSPTASKYRLVYDMEHRTFGLPGILRRGEGQPATGDAAVDEAYDFAGDTYDFYREVLGRNSLDNRGMTLVSSAHFGPNTPNAFWNGEQMLYGDGDGILTARFTKAIDVVAHELTHGVTDYTSGLIYEGESGALNESFSDMMGTAVEFFFQPAGSGSLHADYLLAEDVVRPGGLRSMSNPASFGDPDHYSLRFTGPEDNGGVHTNSGIPNNAYYLAIEGGTHRVSKLAVQGVGGANRDQIEKIFYRAFTQMLPPSADFHTARAATIQAARDLQGASSAAERAVTQAWTAVGVE
jgi:thermolysin